jgi:hypothetical protein
MKKKKIKSKKSHKRQQKIDVVLARGPMTKPLNKGKIMKDRFDLENEITTLYSISTNLETLSEGILEHNLTQDDIVNAIEGIKVLLIIQANKLMDTMSQCFKLDKYRDTRIETEDYL